MTIQIRNTNDWQVLSQQGLTTVVDPMVFRCGEIFLKGASAVDQPDEMWSLLSANVHALGMFFDRLILDEKLPIFNYGDTFDMGLDFDERILAKINEYDEEILFDVNVDYNAYHVVKDAALTELTKVIVGPQKIERKLGKEILTELAVAEYRWSPHLGLLLNQLRDEEEKRLAAFFLGGLIFSGYAQQMGGEHVLQPKRSRLFLAASLRAESADNLMEERLFADLKSKANSAYDELPWRPTFFPYLLSMAESPVRVLEEVVLLRSSAEVKDYRRWLREAMAEWEENGRISNAKKNDIRAILASIERTAGGIPVPQVKVQTTVADVTAFKLPGVGLDLMPVLKPLWGWFLDSLPGNRYRKLLTRAIVADGEFVKLERRIKTVWRAR